MTTKSKKISIAKPQVPKPKATIGIKTGVKSGPKNVKIKKLKPGAKSQPRAAPIVEAGYSLYSSESEELLASGQTTPQEVCAKVLSQLTARRSGHKNTHTLPYFVPAQMPSAGPQTLFNNRLTSSTPDPETDKDFDNKYFQVIPAEKESALSLYGSNATKGPTVPAGLGYFSLPTKPIHTGASLGVTSNLSEKPHIMYQHKDVVVSPPDFAQDNVDGKHESVMEAFQPYIARESTGFAVPAFGNNLNRVETGVGGESRQPLEGLNRPLSSESSKTNSHVKENSLLSQSTNIPSTAETSGTEYAVLPFALTGTPNQQLGVHSGATYLLQDGLFQIHPTKDAGGQIVAMSEPSPKSLNTPISPVQSLDVKVQTAKPATQNFEIPEKDESGKNNKQSAEYESENHPLKSLQQSLLSDGNQLVNKESLYLKEQNQPTLNGQTINQHTSHQESVNNNGYHGFVPNQNYPITVQIPPAMSQPQVSQNVVPLVTPPSQFDKLLVIGSNGSQQLVPMASQGMMVNQYPYLGHPNSDAEVQRLRHLLKELVEFSKISKDIELDRLISEVNKSVNSIPHLNLNLRTEVDLALQPLRTENCHLRRRLRIVNQQLREREQIERDSKGGKQVNVEVVQLQAKNSVLSTQINDGKEKQNKLANDIKELQKEINRMKAEKHQMMGDLSEKETNHLKLRQECLKETQKSRQELDLMEQQLEGLQLKLEAAERENHILQISLKQRDAEVSRHQDTIRSLKDNMAAMMQDLESGKQGERSYIHNSSFSLQKILKLLQEDQKYSFTPTRSVRSDPGKIQISAEDFQYGADSHFRLTKENLDDHDKAWTGEDSQETLRESASDTEVEYALMEMKGNQRKHFSKHSPKQTHPQGHYEEERDKPHRRSLSFSPKQIQKYKRTENIEKWKEKDDLRNPRKKIIFVKDSDNLELDGDASDRRERVYTEKYSSKKKTVPKYTAGETTMDQSRYSVTDYFQKYPTPLVDEENAKNTQRRELQNKQPYNQKQLFSGTELDASVSAIDDDKFSSVSGKTLSTVSTATTVDDQAFRKGIAMLDANIAKLQSDLQKRRQLLT